MIGGVGQGQEQTESAVVSTAVVGAAAIATEEDAGARRGLGSLRTEGAEGREEGGGGGSTPLRQRRGFHCRDKSAGQALPVGIWQVGQEEADGVDPVWEVVLRN